MSKKETSGAKEKNEIGGPRLWLTNVFSGVEDIVYVGLGLLLSAGALALLIGEAIALARNIVNERIADLIVPLLDQILLIVIFVELLFTIKVSFREHVLEPSPFLVVGLIALTRRIIVLSAEFPRLIKEGDKLFQFALMELGLLTLAAIALVFCLRMLRPQHKVED
jgi:hypothetical protein